MLRKIFLSNQFQPENDKKKDLAEKMNHSVKASKNYRDQIGKDVEMIEVPKGMKTEIEQIILDYLELHSQD